MRFRPDKKGLRASLFDLEADIMEIIWDRGLTQFAVNEVLSELEKDRDIAYTTVMTTMSRLHDKGLLARKRDGRRYLYTPRMTRDDFAQTMAKEVLSSLSGLAYEQAVALLVEQVADSDVEELRKLESIIRKRKKALNQ